MRGLSRSNVRFKHLNRHQKTLMLFTFPSYSCDPTHCKTNITFTLARHISTLKKSSIRLKEQEKGLILQEYQ